MTYGVLKKVFEENHIPEDAILMSDSGWELDPTHMDCVYYSREANLVIFTQCGRCEYEGELWQLLYDSTLFLKERK